MGTNFYAVHIPTESEYASMQEAVTNKKLDKLREFLDKSQKKYHIGKRSCGWQFLFSPHIHQRDDWQKGEIVSPWEDTLESLKEYLSRDDVRIENEYGDVFTPDQFWNDEIGYCLYRDKDHINGEDYDKRDPSKYYRCEDLEYTTKEGLRFSKDADFF